MTDGPASGARAPVGAGVGLPDAQGGQQRRVLRLRGLQLPGQTGERFRRLVALALYLRQPLGLSRHFLRRLLALLLLRLVLGRSTGLRRSQFAAHLLQARRRGLRDLPRGGQIRAQLGALAVGLGMGAIELGAQLGRAPLDLTGARLCPLGACGQPIPPPRTSLTGSPAAEGPRVARQGRAGGWDASGGSASGFRCHGRDAGMS